MKRGVVTLGLLVAAAALFALVVAEQSWWAGALAVAFPSLPDVVFPSATLGELVVQHLTLVLISSAITITVGVPLGIWVTRPSGADFRSLVNATVDLGQTFPPIAVLALAMPVLGLGPAAAIVALSVYGLFPVVSGTVAGLDGVPASVVDAARGLGMGHGRILLTVELPLAARVIMGGIRTSVIINIGTATIAAVAGAGGLGAPIVSGINLQNGAYVVEGAAAAAALALLADALLARVEDLVTPAG